MKKLLIVGLLSLACVACSDDESDSAAKPELELKIGAYATLLEVIQSDDPLLIGPHVATLGLGRDGGVWSLCTSLRCYDVVFEDGTITASYNDTGTLENDNEDCTWTADEVITFSVLDDGTDDKIEGWLYFDTVYSNCATVSSDTFNLEAYLLGVNLESLF